MKEYIAVSLCLLQVSGGHRRNIQEEPSCISRFDYDFNMLKKMVDIAKENEELRETVRVLTARVNEIASASKYQQPSNVAFYAQLSRSLDKIGNHQVIKFDHIITNTSTVYNSESGIFSAPSSGMYLFHWVITNEAGSFMNTELYANGKVYGKAMSDAHDHADRAVASNVVILLLGKGDQVWIRSGTWHDGKIQGDFYSTFSGYRLF